MQRRQGYDPDLLRSSGASAEPHRAGRHADEISLRRHNRGFVLALAAIHLALLP